MAPCIPSCGPARHRAQSPGDKRPWRPARGAVGARPTRGEPRPIGAAMAQGRVRPPARPSAWRWSCNSSSRARRPRSDLGQSGSSEVERVSEPSRVSPARDVSRGDQRPFARRVREVGTTYPNQGSYQVQPSRRPLRRHESTDAVRLDPFDRAPDDDRRAERDPAHRGCGSTEMRAPLASRISSEELR